MLSGTNLETARVRVRTFLQALAVPAIAEAYAREHYTAGKFGLVIDVVPTPTGAAPLYLEDLRVILDAYGDLIKFAGDMSERDEPTPEQWERVIPTHESSVAYTESLMAQLREDAGRDDELGRASRRVLAERSVSGTNYMVQAHNIPWPSDAPVGSEGLAEGEDPPTSGPPLPCGCTGPSCTCADPR
jgi:hypothetical protein